MMFDSNEVIEASSIEQRMIKRAERGVISLAFGQIFYGIICAFLGYLFFLSIVFVAIAAIGIYAVRRRNIKLLMVFSIFSVVELVFLALLWISLLSGYAVWWVHLIMVMILVFHILGIRNTVTLMYFARKYGPITPEIQNIDLELQDTPMQTVTVETVQNPPQQMQQQQPIAMLQQQPMFYPTPQQQQIAMLQQPPMFYNPQQQMQQPMFYYPQQMQQQPIYTPTYPQQQMQQQPQN